MSRFQFGKPADPLVADNNLRNMERDLAAIESDAVLLSGRGGEQEITGTLALETTGNVKLRIESTSTTDAAAYVSTKRNTTGEVVEHWTGTGINAGADWGVWDATNGRFLLFSPANGDVQVVTGNLLVTTAGKGLSLKEGANAKAGVATLTAGTVTVNNTSVTANSRFVLTAQDNNSTGSLRVSARTAGTSFVITSSNGADTGVVYWEMKENT